MSLPTPVQPAGWPRPRGYVNGMIGTGRRLYIAGQIGWDENEVLAEGFVEQFGQALDNVVAVCRAAGGEVEHIASMTIFVTDLNAYRGALRALSAAWRARLGRHYPSMALVGVAGLVMPGAMVEIQAIAELPIED